MYKLTLLLFFTLYLNLHAATVTDDFETGLNGWTSSQGSLTLINQATQLLNFKASQSNQIRIFTKTYTLGAVPNSLVTINYDAWIVGGWEASGGSIDYHRLSLNGDLKFSTTFPGADSSNTRFSTSITETGQTDNNGDLIVQIGIDVSVTGEQYQIDNVVITYDAGPAEANDDSFTTTPGTTLTENVFTNDTGPNIQVTSTPPSTLANGTVTAFDTSTGAFTYVPNTGFEGTDTFTYEITDDNLETDTATVTINVVLATVFGPENPFNLLNAGIQNVRGDVEIAGNTVLCLIDKQTGYGTASDTCIDTTSGSGLSGSSKVTSNNYVTRYIDIDSDPSTWNSSSSYITLPDSYDKQYDSASNTSKGIAWAGIFWQGRLNSDNDFPIRYGVANGSNFNTIATGSDAPGNTDFTTTQLVATNVNQVLFDINGSGYIPVQANTLYHNNNNSNGTSYAAYANVTNLLQAANLNSGDITFTLANITTAEGREKSPGLFGGWSLVVIYSQDFNGKPRNISVYSGYDKVRAPSDPIPITGFKLPSSGEITSKLSMFSGEGEEAYGPDFIQISEDGITYNNIKNPADTNVFNGKMTNIKRSNTPSGNELVQNNAGVEVDEFDTSSRITTFNRNITTMYIQWSTVTGGDYITPSMMVFSTELYTPSACYDFAYDFNKNVIFSENGEINASKTQYAGIPLRSTISISSLDGDFDFSDTKMTVRTETDSLIYQSDSAEYAGTSINAYDKMIPDQIHDIQTDGSGFTIAMGRGTSPTSAVGGVISAGETHFFRFLHDINTSGSNELNTNIKISLDYFVDYGSGLVPIHDELDPIEDRCNQGTTYNPDWGIFNIVNEAAVHTTYNLPTQVSGRDFNAKLVGYGSGGTPQYTNLQAYDTQVEIEIFDSGYFGGDTARACLAPDISVSSSQFIAFAGTSEVDINDFVSLEAKKNAAFKIWLLEDANKELVQYNAPSYKNQDYFKTLYTDNYSTDTKCVTECGSATSGCYDCLRRYYGKTICSRDNFALRPETYRLELKDPLATPVVMFHDNKTIDPKNIVAGYDYALDIKAIAFASELVTPGYTTSNKSDDILGALFTEKVKTTTPINKTTTNGASVLNLFSANALCNEKYYEGFKYEAIIDGIGTNDKITFSNVGEYEFHVLDTEWTKVDNPGNFPVANPINDCISDSSLVAASGAVGCNISSDMPTRVGAASGAKDIQVNVVPYAFNISNVVLRTPNYIYPQAPSPYVSPFALGIVNPYVYTNNLSDDMNRAPYNGNGTMGINFRGAITPVGKDTTALTNFTKGCYADNLDIGINYIETNNLSNIPLTWRESALSRNPTGGIPLNGNSIVDPANGDIVNVYGTSTPILDSTGRINTPTPTRVALFGDNFLQANNGSEVLDLYLNYDRTVDGFHNPISLTINSIDVNCLNNADCIANANGSTSFTPLLADANRTVPTTTAGMSINEQGKGAFSWKIFGDTGVNILMYYARAHTPRYRVPGNNARLNTYYEVFCDTTTGCAIADLNNIRPALPAPQTPVLSVDDTRWYQNTMHTPAYGTVIEINLAGAPNAFTRDMASFNQLDTNQTHANTTFSDYQYNGLRGFPFKASIFYIPNSWLIFNRFDSTALTNSFELEFENAGGWTGLDASGANTSGNPSNTNVNRRIQW